MNPGTRTTDELGNWKSSLPIAPASGKVEVRLVLEGRPAALRVSLAWICAATMLTAYAAVLLWYSPLPLQDYPTHIARAGILADLIFHHGARFGAVFQYHFLAIPYILGDLLMAGATEIFGASGAAALWSVISFLSLPAALLFFLRAARISTDGWSLLLVLSAYLSTDWFFLMGFLEFRLGIAATLVALGVAESARRRASPSLLVWYAVTLLVGYLTHLTVLIFATAIVFATALLRLRRSATRARTELALLLPSAVLLAWHLGFARLYRAPSDLVENPYIWGPAREKLIHLIAEFDRFRMHTDAALLALLALCLALYLGWVRRRALYDTKVTEFLALAAIMLGLYFVLPQGYSEAFYVDVRALPLAFLFVVFAVLSIPATERRRARPVLALGIAMLLAAVNLAYLVRHISTHGAWLNQYRALIEFIPRNTRVLPVYTGGRDGNVEPRLYAFSFAVIDRDAIVPYLQTGDTGNPQKYVRYRSRPYAPDQFWYARPATSYVDWNRVACTYDFILISKPYDIGRLQVPLEKIRDNASASLFALPAHAECGVT